MHANEKKLSTFQYPQNLCVCYCHIHVTVFLHSVGASHQKLIVERISANKAVQPHGYSCKGRHELALAGLRPRLLDAENRVRDKTVG